MCPVMASSVRDGPPGQTDGQTGSVPTLAQAQSAEDKPIVKDVSMKLLGDAGGFLLSSFFFVLFGWFFSHLLYKKSRSTVWPEGTHLLPR